MPQFKPKQDYKPELDAAVDRLSALPEPTEYGMILGVRRIKTGSFAGLWELTELDAHGAVKRVITDANTRSIIINLAAREIGKCL